jgi:Kef-type K+ transport system membrane component KefB
MSFLSSPHAISLLAVRSAPDTSIISGVDPTKFVASDPLRLFLIQAGIIIIFTRILAYFLAKIRQPSVIAEVIGGILLGPTVMGRIPGFTAHIFPAVSVPYLSLVANLGLVLFLFLVGLEVDLKIIRRCAFSSSMISLSGLLIPFGLGAAVSYGIYKNFINTVAVSYGHFLLFTGVAMSITALPVLARIVLDLKLIQTEVGNVVLAAGVGNDVVGWILLALAIALVNATSGINALYIFLVALGWTLFLFFVVKPALFWWASRRGDIKNGPSRSIITIIILLVFTSAFLTDAIGVHAIFGAFLVGLIIPHDNGFAIILTEKIEDVVSVIFLPLYFTLSGLSTNLGTLNTGLVWGYTIAICIIAFVSKFIGCAGAAKLTGFNMRESAAIGTLMSCKGLVELIVLNLGLTAGILNTRVFSMFVVMALVTTCATTPLTQLVYPERYRTFMKPDAPHLKENEDDIVEKESGLASAKRTGISNKRFLVVLDQFDHLPSLLSFLQLLKPTSRASSEDEHDDSISLRHRRKVRERERSASEVDGVESSHNHSSTDGDNLPILLSSTGVSRQTSLDAIRIVELTERTSAVMRVAETDDTLRADPMVNVFRTFANLNRLPVKVSMKVVSTDQFSSVIVDRAKEEDSNLIILPWTLPTIASMEGNNSSAFLNPMESFFGSGSQAKGDGNNDHYHHQAVFVRKVIQNSACDVGLLLDRNRGATNLNTFYPHVLFGFMGGPDDRTALSLVMRMCKANEEVKVIVYRFKKSSDADDVRSPPNTYHHTDSLVKPSGGGGGMDMVQDTMYPHSAGFTPLQAQLKDDLAIQSVQEQLKESSSLSSRFVIQECITPTPLHDLVALVEKDARASLIVVGRNRRLPTITHRAELRRILTPTLGDTSPKDEKVLNSETCTVIGEAGIAISRASACKAPILIVASALASTRSEDA